MNPRIAASTWRRLFDYPWLHQKPDFGCVVTDRGRIVGFLGAVYADREVAGTVHRTANLTSWYLERPYRGGSLGLEMLLAATHDSTTSYTVFSSRPRVLRFMRRAGLRELDATRLLWWRGHRPRETVRLAPCGRRRCGALDRIEQRVINDHAPFDVRFVLCQAEAGDCLVAFVTQRKRDGTLYYDVLYLSRPGIFATFAQAFADALLPTARPAVVAVDARLLGDYEVPATTAPITSPRYYRRGTLPPQYVDLLYSELVLLDLKLF